MKRFVILSQPRTGSRMLRTALDAHPQICCYGEVFNTFEANEFPSGCIRRRLRHATDLIEYVWNDHNLQASGFVLHDSVHKKVHPKCPHEAIATYPDPILGIWLSRRDKLAQFVSWRIAEKTGQWSLMEENHRFEVKSLKVDLRDLRDWLRRVERDRRVRQQALRHLLRYELFYEDIVINMPEQLAKICAALEVEYQTLRPTTVKQQLCPLEEVIENYVEAQQTIEEYLEYTSRT